MFRNTHILLPLTLISLSPQITVAPWLFTFWKYPGVRPKAEGYRPYCASFAAKNRK